MRHNGARHVKVLREKFIFAFVFAALALSGGIAQADPVGDFFKRLGNSLAHPQKHPRKRTATASPGEKNASPTPAPSPSPTATEQVQRATSAAADPKNKKRDVPYGIPVPNKPGFVTSPFAPNGGYVDVRGFPSGTEVKDPYTGKIFLTP
ncbi:MAG: hypothetical protein QOI04_212 [Verrucomicrobiota bacterium]|jgi:hypothetical protein